MPEKKQARPEKIIVAVHGIGEQVRSETIQAVANQLCRYCGLPASMPLGRFTAKLIVASDVQPTEFALEMQKGPGGPPDSFTGTLKQVLAVPAVPGAFLIQSPPDPEFAGSIEETIGFGEVYWADIPRGPAKDRYTLEEAKKWARTVVERVRALEKKKRAAADGQAPSQTEYALAAQVIAEMIETTRVLGQLLFLAEKVTPFRFQLDEILVNYLGDVQVVAEFENYRNKIVGLFQRVMAQIVKDNPQADLYLVAHSEGTVIAFLGILEAFLRLQTKSRLRLDNPQKPEWALRIKGLMTIGSPIDKHLFLWPHLWDGLGLPDKEEWNAADGPIPWRNYFDYGDPIGYRLDRAREWLQKNGWGRLFNFDEQTNQSTGTVEIKGDIAFTRYPFAGKAHTDYWEDEAVFGHFIHEVVHPTPTAPKPAAKEYPPPGNRRSALLLSPTLPYLVPFAILLLGVYLIYRAFGACLNLDEGARAIGCSVLAVGGLLAGVTAAVRIPRLTRDVIWRCGGVLCFFAGVAAFLGLLAVGAPFEDRLTAGIGLALRNLDLLGGVILTALLVVLLGWCLWSIGFPSLGVWLMILVGGALLALLILVLSVPYPILVFLAVVAVGSVSAYCLSKRFPSWGAKPMILVAGVVLVLLILVRLGVLGDYNQYQEIKLVLAQRTKDTGDELERRASAMFRLFAESPESSGQVNARAFTIKVLDQLERKQARTKAEERAEVASPPHDPVLARVAQKLDQRPTPTEAPPPQRGSVWPVFVAGAVFLYLWWLAAMCFDLLVVWNYYIRESGVITRLKEHSLAVERQSLEAPSAVNPPEGHSAV